MKMTNREKVLLLVLFVSVFSFVFLRFFSSPLKDEIAALEVLKETKTTELQEMNTLIASKNDYNVSTQKYITELETIANRYYIKSIQEDYIILLNDFNDTGNLDLNSFSFSNNSNVSAGKQNFVVRFNYTGPYKEVYSYMNTINNHEKEIKIKNMNIRTGDKNMISGQMEVSFESIPYLEEIASAESIFDERGNLVNKQLFTPYNRYDSLQKKYVSSGENSIDEVSQIELYLKNRVVDPITAFNTSPNFFVGTDPEVTGNITQSPNRLYGQNSLQLNYNFGVRKVNTEANLVFEDNLIIKDPEEFVSVWVNPTEVTGHQIGLVLVDALGESYDLNLASNVDWKDWKVLEAKIPINVTYPSKVQRIYVRSTGYDQRLGGSVLFNRLQMANTREIVEND